MNLVSLYWMRKRRKRSPARIYRDIREAKAVIRHYRFTFKLERNRMPCSTWYIHDCFRHADQIEEEYTEIEDFSYPYDDVMRYRKPLKMYTRGCITAVCKGYGIRVI